jgi:hypothetical protein
MVDVSVGAGTTPAKDGLNSHAGRNASSIRISGVIEPGTYRRFMDELRRKQPSMVIVDGPGGRVLEAMMIGTEIRRRGISTVLPGNRSCASACALIYLSGAKRYIGPRASIGVHSAANHGRDDESGTTMMARYLSGIGVPSAIVKKMAATPSSGIRWLTAAEQRTLGLQRQN